MNKVLEQIQEIIKIALYMKRLNKKPFRPKKPFKPIRPKVLKKAPRYKRKKSPKPQQPLQTTSQSSSSMSSSSTGSSMKFSARIAALELRLAGEIGLYTYKHLKDILHDGGIVRIQKDDTNSKKKSIQKLIDMGLLCEDTEDSTKTLYKLSPKGKNEIHEILADPNLRNPKTLKSLNNWL